jgi:hypothetical protein
MDYIGTKEFLVRAVAAAAVLSPSPSAQSLLTVIVYAH